VAETGSTCRRDWFADGLWPAIANLFGPGPDGFRRGLCSPFSYFRFAVRETGSICDRDWFAHASITSLPWRKIVREQVELDFFSASLEKPQSKGRRPIEPRGNSNSIVQAT
jgi:hypothetical protein